MAVDSPTVGAVLILTGGGVYVIAFWGYCQVCRRLEQESIKTTPLVVLHKVVPPRALHEVVPSEP